MDKDDVKYRKTTRVVAWMDVVLTLIGIVMVLAYAYFLAREASDRIAELNSMKPNTTSGKQAVYREINEITESLFPMWRRAGFISFVGAIQLCVAFVLTRASKSGRSLDDADDMSFIWLMCNFVFLFIWLTCALVAATYILTYIWLVVRVIFLYVGWNFLLEVESAISRGPSVKSQSDKPMQNTKV